MPLPWGLEGGHAGLANEVFVAAQGVHPDAGQTGKVRNRRPRPGDRLFLRAGGGGFGLPSQRDPEAVAQDVRQGYISEMNAREKYRVVLREGGTVDIPATQALRAVAE